MKNQRQGKIKTKRKVRTSILVLTPEERVQTFANLIIDRILEDYGNDTLPVQFKNSRQTF